MSEKALPADIISKWLHDNAYEPSLEALRVTGTFTANDSTVFESGEILDLSPGGYEGILVGGYHIDTDIFTPFTFSGDGKLRVDAEFSMGSADLEIEVDALDGDTVGVYGFVDGDEGSPPVGINVTSEGHLRVVLGYAGVETNSYFDMPIDAGDEEVLLSYVVPVSSTFQVLMVSCSSETDGKFKVKKNGDIVSCKRNSWSNRNIEFDFPYGFKLVAGDLLEVTAENLGDVTSDFNANFYGEVGA
jgi:hypothetical protein